MKEAIKSDNAPAAIGPYSPAVKVGNLLFISGQIGLDRDGNMKETLEEQTEQVLKNLMEILKSAGASEKNVVKTTIYITDMSHFPIVNEIYARYFSEPYPARATVAVKELPKGALVEIEAIAVL